MGEAVDNCHEGEGADSITREEAVKWCRERGYGFVEIYDGWITYTYKGGIRRERID